MPTTAPVDTINPPVTSWPTTPQLIPLGIARTDSQVRVVGMATDVPGLTITPALRGTIVTVSFVTITGGWTLTHHGSGRQIVPGLHDLPLAYTAEAAQFLRQPDPGYWTQPATAITADPAIRRTVAELGIQADHAAAGNRPIWWARESWQATSDSGRPQWLLRCAAPLCTGPAGGPAHGPNHVYDWDNDENDSSPLAHPDKAVLATAAETQEWRQYDEQHWLCPDCATAHQATHHPR